MKPEKDWLHFGGSILDKYNVKIYRRAYRELDGIYAYIAGNLAAPEAAEKMIDSIEEAILSLETFPERGAVRKTGIYAARDYKQLFVKNYVIVYRIVEKEVHIVTVRYSSSNF